jgi:fatty-acyl-CoA synthase
MHTVKPQSRTIPHLVNELANKYPDREALVDVRQRLTFTELASEVENVATNLLRLGIKKGDKVAILMGNRVEWIVADFAILSIGAVMVGVNTWVTTRELQYILSHSDSTAVITTGTFLRHDYIDMLQDIQKSNEPLPNLKHVIIVGRQTSSPEVSFDALRQTPSLDDRQLFQTASNQVRPDDISYILYTSGSTSQPKGVVLQHYALIENMWHIGERQHITCEDRLWLAVSLFWGLGCENALFNLFTHGGCIILQEYFEAEKALFLIKQERCTVFYGTPNMVEALLVHPSFHRDFFSTMRGGATIGTPEQIQRVYSLGLKDICNIYGLTETYGNCTVTDATDPISLRLQSVGRALEGVKVRIVNIETGALCSTGEVGEIRVKGYVLHSYHKDPEKTKEVFDSEGYFCTGDFGFLNKSGHLFFRGRLKEMIKTGGINVSPIEVEEVLLKREDVLACYCIALPDSVLDEVIAVVLVPRSGYAVEIKDIKKYCETELARYKRPRFFKVIEESQLPLTNTGKVKKNELKGMFL